MHDSGVLAVVNVACSANDGAYDIVSVMPAAGLWLYMRSMFEHDPLVIHTRVIGLGVLSRSLRPSAFIKLSCVSPTWR